MIKYINDIYSAPAYHWLMFMKYNNLGFFASDSINVSPKKVNKDIENGNIKDLLGAYHEINDQIIDEFGLNKSFDIQMNLKQEIAMLKLRFIISEQAQRRTEYRLKEVELTPTKESDKDKMTLSKEILLVSKQLGIGVIDIKDYSIFQYLTAKNG